MWNKCGQWGEEKWDMMLTEWLQPMRTHRMYAARPLFVKGKKKVLHCHVHFPKNVITYSMFVYLLCMSRQIWKGKDWLGARCWPYFSAKSQQELPLLSQTLQFPSARRSILAPFSSSRRFPGHCFGSVSGLSTVLVSGKNVWSHCSLPTLHETLSGEQLQYLSVKDADIFLRRRPKQS